MPLHLSKLTSTLRQLSDAEIAKLLDYLASPYFETTPGAHTLLQYLSKFHPYYDEKKTAPEVIQKKVPALGNQKKQANAGSELLKYLERFLAVENFLASKDAVNRHRLKAYKDHHLFEMFNKEHQELMSGLNANAEQDIDAFYQRHMFTELMLSGFDAKLNHTVQNDVHPVIETLDAFYAVKKLRFHCELLNRQRILGIPYQNENIEFVLQAVEPYNEKGYPYVYLFRRVYGMLKAQTFEEGQGYYEDIHRFIQQNTNDVASQSIKETIVYAINYNLYWNNVGYKDAGGQALWGLELKIKYGILLENGKIQPSDFRNIVTLAVNNSKPGEWINQFIDAYSRYLPHEHTEINSAFAKAQYYYYIKAYDKAMPLFQQAQVKEEPIFNAIVRRWQYMCLFEQNANNEDLLFDFLNAYEKYVLRYAIPLHALKDTFAKNIQYCRRLLKATDGAKRKELATTLNNENYFTGKEWLLKQLQ